MSPRALVFCLAVVHAAALSACQRAIDCAEEGPSGPGAWECELPGWKNRPYKLYTPQGYDPAVPVPLVIGIHGGGGDAEAAVQATCPGGDLDHAGCLPALAGREGFALVLPNGTGNSLLPNVRTFNAGGGSDGWMCTSGHACETGVDDVAFMNALLDDVERAINVDPRRVYATGLSNGGAMSYRMACEMAGRITAIAPVGSGNQFETTAQCVPARPVPVLHIHGTEDPCWPYDGGPQSCISKPENMVSVFTSLEGDDGLTDIGWVRRNGCDPTPLSQPLPDPAQDGMSSTRTAWSNCDAGVEVSLITVTGGGHTWPGGYAYAPERAGPVTEDFSANELIWEFFNRFSL